MTFGIRLLPAFIVTALLAPCAALAQANDLLFVVIVKSSNYSQDADGNLRLLNYHFFSEVFPRKGGRIESGTIAPAGGTTEPWSFKDHDGSFYFEGGHFSTLDAVDAAFPNGDYIVNVRTPSGDIRNHVMRLMGDDAKSEIPAPVTIALWQNGAKIRNNAVDPGEELTVTWSEYTGARRDPNNIVHDMIFVVVADCKGNRIVHTGLPFSDPDYLTFETTEHRIPAGTLRPGQPHSMFVEFPRAISTALAEGVPTFTSFETATYLDFHTTGADTAADCPEKMPPMDTGQTDR